eukprot:1178091-Prorocentrum_minimum.AAC.3
MLQWLSANAPDLRATRGVLAISDSQPLDRAGRRRVTCPQEVGAALAWRGADVALTWLRSTHLIALPPRLAPRSSALVLVTVRPHELCQFLVLALGFPRLP